jgi:hypothetical protein
MPRPLADKPHARIYSEWMDLPAWNTLTPVAQALLVNIMTRYRPLDANAFEISDRTAATLVRASRNTAAKALADLEDRGWLRVVHVGRIWGPKAKRASIYSLTMWPGEVGEPPTKNYLAWRPDPVQRLKPKPSTAQVRAVNGSMQPLKVDMTARAGARTKH